jgi:hypothetical protein
MVDGRDADKPRFYPPSTNDQPPDSANFSVKEKDEASPSRECGMGFAECLHSPICGA